MHGLIKQSVNGTYTVHTPDYIQLSVKTRKDNGAQYVYYKRKQIYLSDIPELSSDTWPVYWDYVFGGGHTRYTNLWYDKLLNLKT